MNRLREDDRSTPAGAPASRPDPRAGRADQDRPPLIRPLRAAVAVGAVAVLAVLAVVTASVVADHRASPAPAAPLGTPLATPLGTPLATPASPAAVPAVMPTGPPRPLHPIRAGAIGSDWQNWSWAAVVNPDGRAPDGTRAVLVTFTDGYAGMSLRQAVTTRPEPAASLRARVWVDGAATWLGLTLQVDDSSPGRHSRDQHVPGGRWVTLRATTGSLGAPAGVRRLTVEHRSAELRGAHRAVRMWISEFSLT